MFEQMEKCAFITEHPDWLDEPNIVVESSDIEQDNISHMESSPNLFL